MSTFPYRCISYEQDRAREVSAQPSSDPIAPTAPSPCPQAFSQVREGNYGGGNKVKEEKAFVISSLTAGNTSRQFGLNHALVQEKGRQAGRHKERGLSFTQPREAAQGTVTSPSSPCPGCSAHPAPTLPKVRTMSSSQAVQLHHKHPRGTAAPPAPRAPQQPLGSSAK